MKKVLIFSLFAALIGGSVACKKDVDEDKLITDYLTSKNLVATKTAEGIHYIVETEGTGNFPTLSNTVSVRYKGYLLSGSVFDENQSAGKAVFTTLLGGGVIQGWKLGLQKFKKGGKGKLFIPSSLAYGSSGSSSGSIPGNTPIVFDIELVDVK
jgi:FKBP-type peptidyl-prolyl cis-trans isomerase FkpA